MSFDEARSTPPSSRSALSRTTRPVSTRLQRARVAPRRRAHRVATWVQDQVGTSSVRAVASLVVVAVVGRGGQPDLAVLAAVVAGGVASWRGRSMISVVVVGGCVYALAAALTALL